MNGIERRGAGISPESQYLTEVVTRTMSLLFGGFITIDGELEENLKKRVQAAAADVDSTSKFNRNVYWLLKFLQTFCAFLIAIKLKTNGIHLFNFITVTDHADNPTPPLCYPFSMIGDDHSEIVHQLFWQTKESGSDGTVRISGGNLNYEMLSIDLTAAQPVLDVKRLSTPVPFIILTGYSNTGSNGIIDALKSDTDRPFIELMNALNVVSAAGYQKTYDDWYKQTEVWHNSHQADCNATAIFSLKHPGVRRVEDSLILISDNKNEYTGVTTALQGHQPIQNDTNTSSVSFYFNQPKFAQTSPHKMHIEVHSGSDEITYTNFDYAIPPAQASLLRPNQFTYMTMTLVRNATGTYKLLVFDPVRDSTIKWPPLPS